MNTHFLDFWHLYAPDFTWDAFCGRWNFSCDQKALPLSSELARFFDEIPVRLVLLAPYIGGNVRTKGVKRFPVKCRMSSVVMDIEPHTMRG